ncbi:Crp/Fnr family transcriptional regulator [Peteryoungia desertarenae]|uniref:Crp/Fnr family transcriptional regulator n=1 Tax=Peteryoungia desertarenae TaxID=1813451 RepID=A0ABX6QL87_9HYPH|nr:Crp/Fnr family transcriptional regulator [Peteryoungia desertarenae]QLF69249.1 Crp/Fnr family transcriptional regulator [Peteryoungia desertarenae]
MKEILTAGIRSLDHGNVSLTLRGSAVFCSLDSNEDNDWLLRCHTRTLNAGESLVDFEDSSKDVFVVQSGEIRAVLRFSIGKEAILGTFKRGDTLGELSAIDQMARSASLMAVSDAVVTVIPYAVFHDILRQRPQVSLSLLQLLSKRIRAMNERLSELSFLDTKHRLYNTLLRLSRLRQDGSQERIISPPLVHAELAEHIGASRETVSREMSRLAREQLVERTSRAIVLKNPLELSRRISRALEG